MPKTRVGDLEVVWDAVGPENGETVLMINGLGAARNGWNLQVDALSPHFRVYTYDNRDVGETGPGDSPRSYGIEQLALDAAGLVETLGIGPVHVIGASLGGAIAQEFVLARPDLVRTVQIVCSWPRTDPWFAELITQWKSLFAAMGPLAWARNSWMWVFTHRWYQDPENLTNLIRDVSAYPYPQSNEMFARQSDAMLGCDTLDRLATVTAPAHVIAGEEDILTPPRFSRQIAEAIPGAKLTVLPDVGHGMFWETPDVFNSALIDFVEANRT